MANQFRQKLAEMDDMQRQIGVRSRDSNRLQELRRALERNRENINAVSQWWESNAKKGGGGRGPPKRRDENLMNQHRGHIPIPGPIYANQTFGNNRADQSLIAKTIPSQNPLPNQGPNRNSMTANLVQGLVLQSIRTRAPPPGRGGPPQNEEQDKVNPKSFYPNKAIRIGKIYIFLRNLLFHH